MTLADKNKCSGCSACMAACAKNAIAMIPDEHGFLYPQIDLAKCVSCGLCHKVCPVLKAENRQRDCKHVRNVYAARTKDKEVLRSSSSGGIFTELAKSVIANGGVVFGCVFEKESQIAIHTRAETCDELSGMRGSKYVQSDLRNTLCEVKEELTKGRDVLFSGTPCQIAGLKSFLGKPFDNLLTVELICHSVPAPKLFEMFKRSLGCPKTVVFRSKIGESRAFETSFYARAFFNHLCSRLSCYDCQFKQGYSGADVTIGDFWGIEKLMPHLNAKDGVSVVVINTPKGENVWGNMTDCCDIRQADAGHAFDENPFYLRSIPQTPKRSYFMKRYQYAKSVDKLLNRTINGPWMLWMFKRVIGKIKRIVKA